MLYLGSDSSKASISADVSDMNALIVFLGNIKVDDFLPLSFDI